MLTCSPIPLFLAESFIPSLVHSLILLFVLSVILAFPCQLWEAWGRCRDGVHKADNQQQQGSWEPKARGLRAATRFVPSSHLAEARRSQGLLGWKQSQGPAHSRLALEPDRLSCLGPWLWKSLPRHLQSHQKVEFCRRKLGVVPPPASPTALPAPGTSVWVVDLVSAGQLLRTGPRPSHPTGSSQEAGGPRGGAVGYWLTASISLESPPAHGTGGCCQLALLPGPPTPWGDPQQGQQQTDLGNGR